MIPEDNAHFHYMLQIQQSNNEASKIQGNLERNTCSNTSVDSEACKQDDLDKDLQRASKSCVVAGDLSGWKLGVMHNLT